MIIDQKTRIFAPIKTSITVPVTALEYAINWPVQFVGHSKIIFTRRHHLIEQNNALNTENLLLKAKVQRLTAIENENNQLKALLHSSSYLPNKMVIAELLAVDVDPYLNQVILNKGRKDRIYVGQVVLDATGVMGQVIQVGLFTSRVLLINDSHSGVPVQIVRNGIRAIAVGDSYSRKLRLLHVPETADVKLGDLLVTSGLGQHYPLGYPVGQIIKITKDPAMQFSNIEIEPSAKLDQSREVLLLWPKNQLMVNNSSSSLHPILENHTSSIGRERAG